METYTRVWTPADEAAFFDDEPCIQELLFETEISDAELNDLMFDDEIDFGEPTVEDMAEAAAYFDSFMAEMDLPEPIKY